MMYDLLHFVGQVDNLPPIENRPAEPSENLLERETGRFSIGGRMPSCPTKRPRRIVSAICLLLLSTGCIVGPKYQRPSAPISPAFKEPPPAGWKEAQPNDEIIRGKWWELYNDPELNALEEQVSISNQNVLQVEAQFHAARDAVRIARAALFPVIGTAPSISASRSSGGFSSATSNGGVTSVQSGGSSSSVRQNYNLPFDFSYQVDLWGSIRRSVRASAETAQASAAQLEN